MFKHVYQLCSIFILGSDGKPNGLRCDPPGLVTQLAVKLWKGKPQSEVPHGDRTRRTRPNCSDPEGTEGICEVKAAQFSRLLYTNPVCILSSCSERLQRNLMTISWLTPLDNQGRLMCSINKRRHSAAGVLHHKTFVLNVPPANLAETLLAIGACSGESVDKVERFSAPLGGFCRPGWKSLTWPPEQPEDCPLVPDGPSVLSILPGPMIIPITPKN